MTTPYGIQQSELYAVSVYTLNHNNQHEHRILSEFYDEKQLRKLLFIMNGRRVEIVVKQTEAVKAERYNKPEWYIGYDIGYERGMRSPKKLSNL